MKAASIGPYACRSPYPTVAKVVTLQYKLHMYLHEVITCVACVSQSERMERKWSMLLSVTQERRTVKPSLLLAGTSVKNKEQGEWAGQAAWGWGVLGGG